MVCHGLRVFERPDGVIRYYLANLCPFGHQRDIMSIPTGGLSPGAPAPRQAGDEARKTGTSIPATCCPTLQRLPAVEAPVTQGFAQVRKAHLHVSQEKYLQL
jgi:hypothetical protein